MRPQCGLRAELTEAAVEAARKSPVSRTGTLRVIGAFFLFLIFSLIIDVFQFTLFSPNDIIKNTNKRKRLRQKEH